MKALVRIVLLLLLALLCQVVPLAAATSKLNSLCEVAYPSDVRIQWSCVKLQWTDTPSGLFGDAWRDVLRFNRLDRRHFHGGLSIKVPQRPADVAAFTPLPTSYPEAAQEEKFILIDQAEMFLGAYEFGTLVFSMPVAVGIRGHRVPNGDFRIDAMDRRHRSNLYTIEELGRRYPMHYALRFYVDKTVDGWPSFWIHGRDLPGYPASHGCVGLYDEEMQNEYYSRHDQKVNKPYYHPLTKPLLTDAKRLFRWVLGGRADNGKFRKISFGPRVRIIGEPPL